MRDEGRINELLELIATIWSRDPDMRFNQLIYMLQSEFSRENGGEGAVEETVDQSYSRVGFDLFGLEDDRFIEFLQKKVRHG